MTSYIKSGGEGGQGTRLVVYSNKIQPRPHWREGKSTPMTPLRLSSVCRRMMTALLLLLLTPGELVYNPQLATASSLVQIPCFDTQ